MGILWALFGIVAAGEVVDLEPVKEGTYDCNEILVTGTFEDCNASPYCWYNSTSSKCIDDPCLHTIVAGAGCENRPTVDCKEVSATTHDCVEGGSGAFCAADVSQKPSTSIYDYCFWANLRDGGSSCPNSVCQRPTTGAYKSKCVNNYGASQCQFLGDKDCLLTPKCVWKSPNCLQDPCFEGSEGENCATYLGITPGALPSLRPDGSNLVAGDCVLYQPYKSDGKVASYCVYKDLNKNPNLCYFLNPTDPTNPTDYTDTYPTYAPTGITLSGGLTPREPDCAAGNISNCDTNPSGECFTKLNTQGAFAGKYCGDATHGAANILHVPSLVVLLLAFIIVSKFTS